MNDFKKNIAGFQGVLKAQIFYKKASDKERTVLLVSGQGCAPDDEIVRNSPHFGHGRDIEVKLSDGTRDTISSYDLAYVIDNSGKKIKPTEPNVTEVTIAETKEV